jgi:hypothetical protein
VDIDTMEKLCPDASERRNVAARPAPVPQLNVHNGDAVKQWLDLKQSYMALRGSREGKNRKHIPRTTHSDVIQISTAWTRELGKVEPRNEHERSEHARWLRCAERVATLYERGNPAAEYPDNQAFWEECTPRLAVYLESRKVVPSKWRLFLESVVEAVSEVPETVERATRKVAGTAYDLIKEPAKLAAVLIGAAILVPPIVRAFR